jgi:RNA polymerase sigma-70 factor (ECF subfamily)
LIATQSGAQRSALHDPDVRLMLEVRDGSAAAFEELMLRYQNRLVTVLEHLVGGRDLAEDLAQEVFLRVYRARASYTPDARFSTWLFKIANNVATNALRNRSRRREVQFISQPTESGGVRTLDDVAQAASGLMPSRQIDKLELREVVRHAVTQLNERQRLAVLLSKFEQMSYEEIAATMGISVQAVKSLLFRARETLRGVLEPYLNQG